MSLYYAFGGGLGHLTRARAFLHTLGIEKDSAILTASPFAGDKRVAGEIPIIKADARLARNPPAYRDFLREIFREFRVEKLFLDAFPAGITGEFCDFDLGNTEVFYIARLLQWKRYARLLDGRVPRFEKTYVLETLEDAHQKFIDDYSAHQTKLKLIYPEPRLSAHNKESIRKITREYSPFWLIVHAGSAEETGELFEYAEEMREIEKADVSLITISPGESAASNHHDIYPASILFPEAARIFTAGGFNIIEQTEEFRGKHFALPFERRFDDQYARVSRLRQSPRNDLPPVHS